MKPQELNPKDDRRWSRGRKRAYLVFAMAAVFVSVAWQAGLSPPTAWNFLRGQPQEYVVSQPKVDDSSGGSVVRTEETLPRDQTATKLLDATATSTSVEPRPLILVATSPGRTPREGTARLGVDPAAPQTYAAGAILLNGARLAEIHHRFVVLEKDGFRVRVTLDGKPGNAPTLAFVGGETKADKPVLAVDRLSEVMRLSPIYENDLLVGMRVFKGSRAHILSQLGLHEGDIVIAINGAPIFEPGGMPNLFEPLLQGGYLSVTVTRANGNESVALDGSVVSSALDGSVSAAVSAASPPTG